MAPAAVKKSKTPLTSLSAYARHRDITPGAVTRAIQEGRLQESVVMHNGRSAIRDVALADREWAANTQSSERTLSQVTDSGVPSLAVSRARLEAARAGLAMLELQEKKGRVVSIEGVRFAVSDKFSAVRTRLLGLPTRIKQRLPHIAADDVRIIDDMVREALEELSQGV